MVTPAQVQVKIKAGADVHIKNECCSWHPLMYAAQENTNVAVIKNDLVAHRPTQHLLDGFVIF